MKIFSRWKRRDKGSVKQIERQVNQEVCPLFPDDSYQFDTECIWDGTDYIEVLEEISAISKDGFVMEHIKCKVDHDTCRVDLSFEWNHDTYHWKPVYQDDWFDCGLITKMNEILQEHGSSKFYYNNSNDQTMNLIFSSAKMVEKRNELISDPFELV